MINKRTYLLLLIVLTILTQGCLSTAHLSDFSKTASSIDFNKIANSKNNTTDKSWNSKTGFEYYIKTSSVDDSLVIQAIKGAIMSEGFTIKFLDKKTNTILAERGMRANEWNSVVGTYYKKVNDGFEVYVNCKITQDFTGGWREDRARKIGDIICGMLKNCSQAYSVNTSPSK